MALEMKDQESFAAYTRHMNSLRQTTSSGGEHTKSANNQKSHKKVHSGSREAEQQTSGNGQQMGFLTANQGQNRNSVRQALTALQDPSAASGE